jgi:SpoVK/Ycf46/Vps4 family AAA+-type ATPase
MEEINNKHLLKTIGNVFDKAHDRKLEDSLFEEIEPELNELSEYFKVSKIQGFFIANLLVLNFKMELISIDDLCSHFDCNPMRFMEFNNDIENLVRNEIVFKKKPKNIYRRVYSNDMLLMNKEITNAILNNLPMPYIEKQSFGDIAELLESLYNFSVERNDEEISTHDLISQTRSILESNLHFPLINKIHQMNLKTLDSFVFCFLIWKTITGNEKTDISEMLEYIIDRPSARVNYMQKIISSENELIKRKLIEIEESRFISDTALKLTELSLTMLNEEGIKLFANKKKNNNIIEPVNILSKALYFNEEENSQLDVLKRLLSDSELNKIQQRLTEKKLPKGIASLLYGLPGTGKTETVYQLAKETNREIVKVDISQSKSMWFGESEKKIKQIFTDYKEYAKDCERTPILLFNEADAVLSKRKDIGLTNTGQTENTMQNIILEELENFEGIFFATTNLVNNLDSAFERRFLFKIEFRKPVVSVKARIWESRLSNMIPDDYELLAKSFDFSGGQIENIVRKSEMHEVMNGVSVNIQDIIGFCNAENLSKNNGVKIGFTKN